MSLAPGPLTRRRFLVATAASSVVLLTGLLEACAGPPAPQSGPGGQGAAPAGQAAPGGSASNGTLKLLMSSHFVPAYDTWIDQWAQDWGTKNKMEVQVDH